MAPGVADEARAPVTVTPGIPRRLDQKDAQSEAPPSADNAIDGHIEADEARVAPDGREAVIDDARLPEDRAAFLSPPAGYDALAFQIELDPRTDARPQSFARFTPYTPMGHRAGSWVIFPELEAGLGATNNVYRATPAKADGLFDLRPSILAVTDWQRHALQFKAAAVAEAHQKYATENERSYAFEARGRLDITSRANIELLASHSLDQDQRSATPLASEPAKRLPYTTDKVAFAVNQRFNRLSLQLRGGITEVDYQPAATVDGTINSNDARDLSQRDGALRAAWQFSPALGAFAELAGVTRAYRARPIDGVSRDNTGDRVRVGLSFGTTSQIWRGEVATGYGHQRMRDGRIKDLEGMLFDANLAWKPTQLTSVLFKARTDFTTSITAGEGGAVERTFGVELRHAFLRELNAVAGLTVQNTDYQNSPLREQTTTAELGAEYFISRDMTLLGRYQHALVSTTDASGNKVIDSVRFGVRYRP